MSDVIGDDVFANRHKQTSQDFTRNRILTFRAVAVLILTKGMKSLQLSLNEFIPKLGLLQSTVSRVAYIKAKAKFRHTAFIELNREAVVRTMYEGGPSSYKTLHGLRILAADGSQVILPTNNKTAEAFGAIAYHNGQPNVAGEHSVGLASVMYDVLNRVALDAILAPCHSYEVDLAAKHLPHMQDNDLAIYDRGYCSFKMMSLAEQAKGAFLVRCHRQSFKVARTMLAGNGPDDVIVQLSAPRKFIADPNNKELPQTLTVRFVRVTLDTGEYEVLATSLLDQQIYPVTIFKELYYLRWGIETFYGVLKTRLGLENFSGLSPESIQQDFHAAVLLTGVESILTEDAEDILKRQSGGHPKKVNKAVSFNVIKYRAFELFMNGEPTDETLKELTELFQQNPTVVRKDRSPPRVKRSTHRLLGFWRRRRKAVF